MKENGVVKIITVLDNMQAEMIMEALKNNQIPSYKKDADGSGFLKIYGGNCLSGVEIYVAEENAEKAADVLCGMGYEI